jgi:hypothetical protein
LNLKKIIKTVVDNLQYSLIFKLITEIANEDIFVARQDLDKVSDSELMSDPKSLYREAKIYFINRVIDDKELTQKLVEVPKLLGLDLGLNELGLYGEKVIELAKEASMITLLLFLIPRTVIGTSVIPQEFGQQGVDTIVKQLLNSDKSRKLVIKTIENEIRNRKMEPVQFEIASILKGYNIPDEKDDDFINSTIVMTLIISTGLPFILDELLDLPQIKLEEETTYYILTMHTLSALKKSISGTGRIKPFDWPITGDNRSCTHLMNLVEILQDITSSLNTCPMFVIELMSQKMKMSHEDYMVFFTDELVQHYEETLKSRQRKGKNEQLRQFIELIRKDKRGFARRILNSPDKGFGLAKELRNYKLKAKGDFRPDISPEKRYLENLGSLDRTLKIKLRSERFSSELAEDLRPVFDSISEIVKKNEKNLREDIFKFTDTLCFQTCFQILEYMKLGKNLIDLPWISRFIAEEAVRSSISSGELQLLGEEHRTERIIAAYLGGVSYLILQAHMADSK